MVNLGRFSFSNNLDIEVVNFVSPGTEPQEMESPSSDAVRIGIKDPQIYKGN